MNEYEICHDFATILSGTHHVCSEEYQEAAKSIEKGEPAAIQELRHLMLSVEKLSRSPKAKNAAITKSAGNVRQFSGYNDIKTVMEYAQKKVRDPMMKDMQTILRVLEQYQSQYTEGYEKQVRLIILEYESGLYLLVTGLVWITCDHPEILDDGNSTMKMNTQDQKSINVIAQTARDFAKIISGRSHKDYLETLIKNMEHKPIDTKAESVTLTESTIMDVMYLIGSVYSTTVDIVDYSKQILRTIRNTVFGIIPLIRTCCYLRYKKKADTVLALEQQAAAIRQNIEQLENRTNMNPSEKKSIIRRQKAAADARMKRAAKLRAQLCETEKEVATEIRSDPAAKKELPNTKEDSGDDDEFVLESGSEQEEGGDSDGNL